MKIKKGDLIQVITGKDRGKQGEVLKVLPKKGRVVIKGVNKVIKHKKNTGDKNNPGGRIEIEAPIHVSNVMLVSPDSGKTTRKRIEAKQKIKTKKETVKKNNSKKTVNKK
ncbi:50S ribosomal protein L24 [Candidatus Dojkabacteria bacterium]|nr:50S ribosomal protein L24 [Candidatus Dojkabacteria bacterium]